MPGGPPIRKAIVPIAGKGRRMYPLTTVVPKEMLPTPDGPIIESVVRELILSGIEEIILVTVPSKGIVERHLGSVRLPRTASGAPAQLTYLYQNVRSGNGGAILSAVDVSCGDPILVVWGDELFLGDHYRARQLIDAFASIGEPVIALTTVRGDDISKCGIVGVKNYLGRGMYELSGLVEKPEMEDAPSNLASVGGYVITPAIVEVLRRTEPSAGGELYLSAALCAYCEEEPLFGQLVSGEWNEVGSLEGYVKAFVSVASRDPELAHYVRIATEVAGD